jgi:3HB-oligomer hydrolase (3HBOH)
LTAGLGKGGLGSMTPPGFADALHPTAEELRRSAIYGNYRALVDPTRNGGYGVLYGPNVGVDGVPTESDQHLDTLNGLRDYAKAYVPLHHYLIQALDLMYDHLRNGRTLPPSQLVRTYPRGDTTRPISADNVPRISDTPPPSDRITFTAAQVQIPN